MKDIGIDKIFKNIDVEVTPEGIRVKIFTLPYFLSLKDLDDLYHSIGMFMKRVIELQRKKGYLEERK